MSTFRGPISREIAARYGREAAAIGERGHYQAPSGQVVDIQAQVERAVRSTTAYPPGAELKMRGSGRYETAIQVMNETTLSAARRLIRQGLKTVALNFASATHPGGGFLQGARAQEEYLARSSGLYQCLRDQPMYAFHRQHYDPLYSDYTLYSPEVPVFRGDDGALLEEPYPVSIITAAAVNARQLPPKRRAEIGPAMMSRIEKVLAVGLAHENEGIVLGAWGCGAFGNDGDEIAGLFRRALDGPFKGAYQRVAFAIVDWSAERRFIGPFERVFETRG